MIFKLKTSQKTQQIFAEIGKSTSLKPYTLVKHAIAWSLKEQGKITSFSSDNEGLELNRQTITGEYDDYFKVLIEQAEGRHLSNEEYFPKYIKAHILGLIPGVVTPLGLLNDLEHKVTFWLDKSFLEGSGLIGVHPNDNTATVWLKTQDLLQLLEEDGTQITLFEA